MPRSSHPLGGAAPLPELADVVGQQTEVGTHDSGESDDRDPENWADYAAEQANSPKAHLLYNPSTACTFSITTMDAGLDTDRPPPGELRSNAPSSGGVIYGCSVPRHCRH